MLKINQNCKKVTLKKPHLFFVFSWLYGRATLQSNFSFHTSLFLVIIQNVFDHVTILHLICSCAAAFLL